MFTRDTCCTLVPYFEVQEGQLEAFKALGPQFVAKTRTEPGCVHYAFSFSGNTAHCREGYVDANAVLAHLQNVGELLGQALKIARIVRLERTGKKLSAAAAERLAAASTIVERDESGTSRAATRSSTSNSRYAASTARPAAR